MDVEDLRAFLVESNAAGYAGGDEKLWTSESDHSTTIRFSRGPWSSHDNFFGGEPYGGRMVVFHDSSPVWMLVYYGWVAEQTDPDQVYGVLRKALMHMPAEAPYRGPERHDDGAFTYTNKWDGGIERFSGEEEIHEGGRAIYQATYLGGLVDMRRGA